MGNQVSGLLRRKLANPTLAWGWPGCCNFGESLQCPQGVCSIVTGQILLWIYTAKFRRGSNTVITPFKAHRADFKIEEDRGRSRNIKEDRGSAKRSRKIEERSRKDRGRSRNDVFFSEMFLGNFRDAGVLGIFGRMVCADGPRLGARLRLEEQNPPTPPSREIDQSTQSKECFWPPGLECSEGAQWPWMRSVVTVQLAYPAQMHQSRSLQVHCGPN